MPHAKLQYTGIYRAIIEEQILTEAKSGALMISFRFVVAERLEPNGTWKDLREYEPQEVWGQWALTKKTGEVNTSGVQQIANALGWSGDIADLENQERYVNTGVQITVKEEEYEGQKRLKAAWMAHWDYTPQGRKPAGQDAVAQAKSRYGAKFRDICKSVPKPAPPPSNDAPTGNQIPF